MSERIPVKNISPVKVHYPDKNKHGNSYTPRNRIYVRAVTGMLENIRRFFGMFFLVVLHFYLGSSLMAAKQCYLISVHSVLKYLP